MVLNFLASKQEKVRYILPLSFNSSQLSKWANKCRYKSFNFNLKIIIISASEGLLCKYCGKSFEKYYNFKYHIDVVHRGMKPFGCKKCSKKFGRRSDAKRHTEEHCKG